MLSTITLLALIFLGVATFRTGKQRVLRLAQGKTSALHSLPSYYGSCTALWSIAPAVALYVIWAASPLSNDATARSYALLTPALLVLITIGYSFAKKRLTPSFRARNHIESLTLGALFVASAISVTITLLIIASVLFESIRFFNVVPITDFLFGTHWSPQTAGQSTDSSIAASFGAVPVFLGTLLITFIAMCVATPLGLLSAIYLSEYAKPRLRAVAKPVLEILAGVPTVVYGYFAAITLAPLVRDMGIGLNLNISTESALVAGMVIGVMIIPFILSLSDDVMNAVPVSLRDASYALGATKAETVIRVIVPSALPGIMGAVLLAMSRAIGETMIVVMAAGLAAKLTINPLDSVTTVTAQIVTLLVGDQEFNSPRTLSAFALGLTLFVVTLILNVISLLIVKKYREQYE
ncbi:MAG: pstC [Rickettsiales bacterium]|jgi:phosphate transport system permease protein|nr:pstC [Rickettsiales bacterium]